MMRYATAGSAIAICCLCVGFALPAPAQDVLADDWTKRKCALYATAWQHFAADGPPDGVSSAFLADHDAFLASGCIDRGMVCPRTQREHEIADMLSFMAVSEGIGGSFLPFACAD